MEEFKMLVEELNDKIYYSGGVYSQFTIDVGEQLSERVNEDTKEGEGLGSESDLIGSCCYQIDTIVEVLKDGKDKELFADFLKAIRLIDDRLDKSKIKFKTLPKKDQ